MVGPGIADEAGAEQVDGVALALRSRKMGRDWLQLLNRAAQLFPHLADRGLLRLFPWPDTAAGQDEQVAVAVIVANQQQFARAVEQHHLDAARPRPKQAPELLLDPIGKVDERPHGALIMATDIGAR